MPTNLSTPLEICEHCIVRKKADKDTCSKAQGGNKIKVKLKNVYLDITAPKVVTTNSGEIYMLW